MSRLGRGRRSRKFRLAPRALCKIINFPFIQLVFRLLPAALRAPHIFARANTLIIIIRLPLCLECAARHFSWASRTKLSFSLFSFSCPRLFPVLWRRGFKNGEQSENDKLFALYTGRRRQARREQGREKCVARRTETMKFPALSPNWCRRQNLKMENFFRVEWFSAKRCQALNEGKKHSESESKVVGVNAVDSSAGRVRESCDGVATGDRCSHHG